MQTLCRNRSLCLLFRKDAKPQLLNNNLQYLTKARSQINAPQLRYKPKAIPRIGGIAMVVVLIHRRLLVIIDMT